uniref:WW domain-containing protein n=1 Tax=Prymnesium polylepis TaxID=72548 RepID=A0A7S4MZ64_9EUKA
MRVWLTLMLVAAAHGLSHRVGAHHARPAHPCRSGLLRCNEDPRQWRKASLAEHEYWWRSGETAADAIEITTFVPTEAWRVGMLPSGRPYLWRPTTDPDDPEVQLWQVGTLETGTRYWFNTDDGAVTLSDPHDLYLGYKEV